MKNNCKTVLILITSFFSLGALAAPIDWNGTIGFDALFMGQYGRTSDPVSAPNPGSEEITAAASGKDTMQFQSYVFKLRPTILINDSISFHAELSTGPYRGGFLGGSSQITESDNAQTSVFGNTLHHFNTGGNDSYITLRKFHLNILTDLGTIIAGRFSRHWGIGALVHGGDSVWDRYMSSFDGVGMNISFGKFSFFPYWSKVNSTGEFTSATDANDFGMEVKYENKDSDLEFGLRISSRTTKSDNTTFQSNISGVALGKTKVRSIDLYAKKKWSRFSTAIEVPILSGELGHTYSANEEADLISAAVLMENQYQLNDHWRLHLNFGYITGDDGNTNKFKAMYLNPNYQIAHMLFRYNLNGVASTNQGIFDNYITNANFLKAAVDFEKGDWSTNFSLIYARANRVAENGESSFDHEQNSLFTATEDQDKSLGLELDLTVGYQWGKYLKAEFLAGYHLVGKYYEFNNGSGVAKVKNPYLVGLRFAVDF